jgi:hypothetical protein
MVSPEDMEEHARACERARALLAGPRGRDLLERLMRLAVDSALTRDGLSGGMLIETALEIQLGEGRPEDPERAVIEDAVRRTADEALASPLEFRFCRFMADVLNVAFAELSEEDPQARRLLDDVRVLLPLFSVPA